MPLNLSGEGTSRSSSVNETLNTREVMHLMMVAFRILRSSADAWAVLSGVGKRLRSTKRWSTPAPTLEEVVRECLAVIDRRAVGGRRFDRRDVRRYQREIMQHAPQGDADVEMALSTLPDRARTVLILRDLEMLQVTEIAEILDVSPIAVRWYLHRARALIGLQLNLDPPSS